MAHTRARAAKLLTAAELKFFESSMASEVRGRSEKQLRAGVARARKLRDKYRDLLRRQARQARGRPASGIVARRGDANERTARKAQLFEEVLGRFEKGLAQAVRKTRVPIRSSPDLVARKRAAQQRLLAARQPAVSPKAPAHGPRGDTASAEATSAPEGAGQRFAEAGAARIQGHVGAAARRSQARRDQRG